jgi:hypothetical protein
MKHRPDGWLTAIVLGHLMLNVAHGAAHAGAGIQLDRGSALFVLLVIGVGPIAGLALSSVRPRSGALVVAATMAAALVFGVVNHFVVVSADHVTQVDARWRALFGSTAVLLALVEAAGVAVGIRRARGTREMSA